jgi:hypothetical protein
VEVQESNLPKKTEAQKRWKKLFEDLDLTQVAIKETRLVNEREKSEDLLAKYGKKAHLVTRLI